MTITADDLPSEIQGILNTEALEGAPISEQPVCIADIRVTAQLTKETPLPFRVLPWRVDNAQKGDLLLTPGGEGGRIGGLLWRLDRRQYFSHMGIFVENETTIRHATAIGERTQHENFFPNKIFGKPAPTNGIDPNVLRYGWPGTITQSVEEAYLTWRDHPKETNKYESGRDIPLSEFSRLDTVTGERFHIDSLTFGIAMVNDVLKKTDPDNWRAILPIVVMPCRFLETPEVRATLHRIADTAKNIHGHYRLYAYSRGDIVADPAYLGPQMLETETRDTSESCTGALFPKKRIEQTVPVVCSTLIWWAIQEANRKGGKQIVIDNRPAEQRLRLDGWDLCRQDFKLTVPPTPINSRVCVFPSIDGMYRYSEAERLRSGNWEHDEIIKEVHGKIDSSIPTVFETLGGIVGLSLSLVHWILASLLSTPTGLVLSFTAQLLGLSVPVLEEIVEWLSDMPDDVATQICNTFAFDKSEEVDDPLWQKPGEGYSVSPDDILNEWAEVQGENHHKQIIGLYGHNEVAQLAPPTYDRNPPPSSSWQISQGKCDTFRGQVSLLARNGQKFPARGAQVRIGSHLWYTDPAGFFSGTGADQGRYWTVATYRDSETGLIARSKGFSVEMGPGGPTTELDYLVELPPESHRLVTILVKMYLVNRKFIIEDWIGKPQFIMDGTPLHLDKEAYGFPDTAEFKSQREQYLYQGLWHSEGVDDWGACQVRMGCWPHPDGRSIGIDYSARLVQNEEIENDKKNEEKNPPIKPVWPSDLHALIPPTDNFKMQGFSLPQIELMRNPTNPVRAYIDIEVRNTEAP
jgi:hypothetical protein